MQTTARASPGIALPPALLAGARSRGREPTGSAGPTPRAARAVPRVTGAAPQAAILAVAFVSGFATLALEVLCTRMFAQVLHNSVYSFAAILVTFLISLGLGAVIAHLLCRAERLRPGMALSVVLCLLGAILGSLIAGFVLLPHLGLWQSIRAMGLVYLATALLVAAVLGGSSPMRLAPLVLLVACAVLLDPARLPVVRLDLPSPRKNAFLGSIIARTMLAVFPQVTLWRGDFLPKSPVVALIGEMAPRPLDPERVAANFRARRRNDAVSRQAVMALTMIFYGGNLSAARAAFEPYALNRDDMPLIEYSTPITQREERAGRASYFTSLELSKWYEALVPSLDRDPYLGKLNDQERGFARAGLALFQSKVHGELGHADEARRLAERFAELVPREVYESFQPKRRE